jgi:hypothetical protein
MPLQAHQFLNADLWDLYLNGAPRNANGIVRSQQRKCLRLVNQIEAAVKPGDLNLPGYGFVQSGNQCSVAVSGPNRISYRWAGGGPMDIDYQ